MVTNVPALTVAGATEPTARRIITFAKSAVVGFVHPNATVVFPGVAVSAVTGPGGVVSAKVVTVLTTRLA